MTLCSRGLLKGLRKVMPVKHVLGLLLPSIRALRIDPLFLLLFKY